MVLLWNYNTYEFPFLSSSIATNNAEHQSFKALCASREVTIFMKHDVLKEHVSR